MRFYRSPNMLPILIVLAVLVWPWSWAGPSWAQGPVLSGLDMTTAEQKDPKSTALRDWLKQTVARGEVPGAALLVAQGGKVVFREAQGLADLAAKMPFTPDTLVLTASTTKPLSATGVMALVDQGKISLDDPVSKYLPAFNKLQPAQPGGKTASPTIRQLLSHTSGLYGLVGATKTGMRAVRDFSLTLEKSVEIVAAEKLALDPGTKFNYGGANFQVAARIAELVSGKSFDSLLRESLFDPLKMSNTFFKPGPDQASLTTAMPYTFNKAKGLVPIAAYLPDPNRNLVLASGGLYSDLNDLAVFVQAHLNNGRYGQAEILSTAAAAQMQTIQTGADKTPYGLGWFLSGLDGQGRAQAFNHPGLLGAVIWADRADDIVGVFLTSSIWPDRLKADREVMGLVKKLFPKGG